MKELLKVVENHTLISPGKLTALYDAANSLKIPGDIIEVGVWKGGSGAVLASTGKQTYLCDTFKGIVNTTDKDPHYSDGEHADTSQEEVSKLLEALKLDNVSIIPGIFPESGLSIENKRFCFAHIDCDVYKSTLESATWIWRRLNSGGLIYFDDYYFERTPGVTLAVNELSHRYTAPIERDTGFAFLRKL